MANRMNKIAKKNWKLSQMSQLLAESLLKGEISPLDHELRDHAMHLFKRKFVYGKATPRRRTWETAGKWVRRVGNNVVLRREDGKYILAK
jgi:uncharacterized protein YhbP (UPF0306 family)